MSSNPIRKLLTPDEASEILGVKASTLVIWRSNGRYNLPFAKIGGKVMYRQQDIEKFITERMHMQTA